MKIIADNHAARSHRAGDGRARLRETVFLDHIGAELRGVYGDVETESLPDALSMLVALLDRDADREDAA